MHRFFSDFSFVISSGTDSRLEHFFNFKVSKEGISPRVEGTLIRFGISEQLISFSNSNSWIEGGRV